MRIFMPQDLKAFQRALFVSLVVLLGVLAFGALLLGWTAAPAWLVVLAQTLVAVHVWARGTWGVPLLPVPPLAWAVCAGAWAGLAFAAFDPARGLAYGVLLTLIFTLGTLASPPARR